MSKYPNHQGPFTLLSTMCPRTDFIQLVMDKHFFNLQENQTGCGINDGTLM